MTILIGKASLFEAGFIGGLAPEQKEAAKAMLKEAYRLNALFDRLLTFVMAGGGMTVIEGASTDLAAYLDKFIERLPVSYPDKKVEVIRRCPEVLPPVKMDEKMLNLIFSNLADNSIKFNDKETVKISISVSLIEKGFIAITFSDNGIGIPSEEYERIFEKFYQIEKSFTGQVEGVGLGLSLVKKLAETSGGSIKVESKLGEGTNFIFTLPLKI